MRRISLVNKADIVCENINVLLRKVAQDCIDLGLHLLEAVVEDEARRFAGLAKDLRAMGFGDIDVTLNELSPAYS